MKKELEEMTEISKEYVEIGVELVQKREFFNTAVEASQDTEDFEEFMDEACASTYDIANNFFMMNADVVEVANKIKSEHPRYGEKRFKTTLVDSVIDARGLDYELSYDVVNNLVNCYLLFTKCGYADVREKELKVKELEKSFYEKADVVTNESKDAVAKVGKALIGAVSSIVKPYADVAKGQIDDAGNFVKGKVESAGNLAKEQINKGVKVLVKKLEDIENKTDKKDN